MEFTSLCLLLASLRISPDRSQFFQHESVSLSCGEEVHPERNSSSAGWGVRRRASKRRRRRREGPNICSFRQGGGLSSCFIGTVYPSDSGAYWCECGERRSPAVNLTVTDSDVILDSPALPVTEGSDVALHCRYKDETTDNPSSGLPADFYKDGLLISTESTGQMTIHNVNRSDGGFYKCNIADLGESPESWMDVRAIAVSPTATSTSSVPSSSAARLMPMSGLVLRLVAFIPYLLSTALLVSIYRDRARATAIEKRMEVAV